MNCVALIGNENVGDKEIKCERKNVFSYHSHSHTHYELIFYSPFDGQITIHGMPFSVTSPTAVLITPYYTHKTEIKNGPCSEYIKIAFNGNLFDEKDVLPRSPLIFKNINDGFIKSAFLEISDRENDTTIIKSILCSVLNVMKQDAERVPDKHMKAQSPHISSVLDFINENYREDITLTQIADMIGLTPQYLSSLFKSEMNIGIKEYINRSRLLCAEEMLKNTKLSVSEICYSCGYNNFSHFLRIFRKTHGISPKEYRKKHL